MPKKELNELTDKELEFYSRQIVLNEIGYNGQLKLKNATVTIVGLGGLGSPIALQLTAMGIGHLRLVDYDVVELSNLQRQHLYRVADIGAPKVEIATKRLQELNPNILIEPLPLSINQYNIEDVVKSSDVVVDGLDRMLPRYLINRACITLSIPYIFAGAIKTYGNVTTILPGKTPCLECFQGNINDELLPTCATVGIHPSILSVIAGIEVSEATRLILGEPPKLANKLLYCDLGNMEFIEVDIKKSEGCPICGSKPKSKPMDIIYEPVHQICGREGRRVFVITPKKNLNIELKKLSSSLKKQGYKIKTDARLGLSFTSDLYKMVSILKSGVMIIEGPKSDDEAYEFYKMTLKIK